MSNVKHYVITSITLGAIAMGSGLLIGATNAATKDRIALNEKNKINAGISEIYGKSASIYSETKKEEANFESNFKYVKYVYEIQNEEESFLGYAFRTSGSNMYGKISLIIGFDGDSHDFIGLSIITNEQTYASTLVDNYINPLNDGEDFNELSVSCGATYGAKLVRAMIEEASDAENELWKE